MPHSNRWEGTLGRPALAQLASAFVGFVLCFSDVTNHRKEYNFRLSREL